MKRSCNGSNMDRVILLFIALGWLGPAIGQTRVWSARADARTIALGNAGAAYPIGLESAIYNCARFVSDSTYKNLHVFLDPLNLYSVFHDRYHLSADGDIRGLEALRSVTLFLKGVTFQRPFFEVACLFTEPLPGNPFRKTGNRFFNSEGLLQWSYDVMSGKVLLAKPISLGVSAFFFNMRINGKDETRFGTSYAVNIQSSSKVAVGVTYYDFPARTSSLMYQQHRFEDENINVGVSYRPFPFLRLAADVLNVTETEKQTSREVHLGLELLDPGWFSIRGGFYQQRDSGQKIVSFGLGLLPETFFQSENSDSHTNGFVLNYSVQIAQDTDDLMQIHLVNFLIRL